MIHHNDTESDNTASILHNTTNTTVNYNTVIPSQFINGADLLVSVAAVNDLGTGDWATTSAKLTFCSDFITYKNDIITMLLLIAFVLFIASVTITSTPVIIVKTLTFSVQLSGIKCYYRHYEQTNSYAYFLITR